MQDKARAQLIPFLNYKAYQMRRSSLIMTTQAGSGHVTSSLSAADIVAALFFHAMQYDPSNPANLDNDRFILSKGHAAPLLYAAWKEVGVLSDKDLLTYRKIDSVLEGHPTRRFNYVEAATGALGIGLSVGLGMTLSDRLSKRESYTYVLLGDAEVAEGAIWEAAEIAAYYATNHLIAILDDNRLGQSAPSLHGHQTERYAQKFAAFGWHTLIIDGHDVAQIMQALDTAQTMHDKPTIIIAKTFKGYGVSIFENKEGWHGKALSHEQLPIALEQLRQHFAQAASFDPSTFQWKPRIPARTVSPAPATSEIQKITYQVGELVATRKAYGQALVELGAVNAQVVSLDAEVKNSTFSELFQAAYPERFFQCFVAEQNMVSMGVGFDRGNKIPFVSTFGAFLTRAYDQIRMAAIGQSTMKLVGSHAGVSIGEDGPSQMALEDIAMMRAIPASIILYPCDAVTTRALLFLMADYTGGISYLRTTRMETPVIYAQDEQFMIGGSKIVKQSQEDHLCIIAAGVTVFQALKAYELLKKENIICSVIDAYSIKPLDSATLERIARASQRRIITVEDHYLQGGLGESVCYALRNEQFSIECLAVNQLPRSGKPEELMALVGIDAASIVKAAKKIVSL